MHCISNISSGCVRAGYWALSQAKPLRRPYFLDVDKVEEVVEMIVPFAHVRAYEGADGLRALGIDIAEEAALDLVVDVRTEEGRIQIRLKERPGARADRSVKPVVLTSLALFWFWPKILILVLNAILAIVTILSAIWR